MTNSTDEYWDVDGVSLQTLAWNLTTWGGSKQGAPSLRGDDLVIPGRPGAVVMPKTVESRTIEFSGWVIGWTPDGQRADLDRAKRNWRMLRNLFVKGDRIVTVTRRWRETEGGAVLSASAVGQVVDAVEPNWSSPGRGEFTFPVYLADPFFYGPETSVSLAAGANAVTVPGDYTTRAVTVEFGPSTTTSVADSVSGRSLALPAGVASGRKVVVDTREFSVKDGTQNALGRLTAPKGPPWLPLSPGAHTLTRSGDGTVTVKFRPVYL